MLSKLIEERQKEVSKKIAFEDVKTMAVVNSIIATSMELAYEAGRREAINAKHIQLLLDVIGDYMHATTDQQVYWAEKLESLTPPQPNPSEDLAV